MKTTKSLIVATLLIAGTTLMAQTQTTRTNNNTDQAYKQTTHLVSSLKLSDEQTVEILAINQKYTNMEAYKATNTQLSIKEARKAQKNLAASQAKEIKSVLKGYQKEKFEYMVANHEVLAPQFGPSMAINNAPQRAWNFTASVAPRRNAMQAPQRISFGAGAPNFQRSIR